MPWGMREHWGVFIFPGRKSQNFSLSALVYTNKLYIESFRVIRPNLLKVHAWTKPDLPKLVIFYLFQ